MNPIKNPMKNPMRRTDLEKNMIFALRTIVEQLERNMPEDALDMAKTVADIAEKTLDVREAEDIRIIISSKR